MNDLISKADAQVLTKPGFYDRWCKRVADGETFTAAYEAVEQLHMTVHEKGEMMYSHFGSFRRQHWKQKNKQKQQSPV